MKRLLLPMTIASALAVSTAKSSALAQSTDGMLKSYEDDTSITLNGTVIEARSDEFDLMVDDDRITVEVDEQFRDGGAYTLLAGDEVVVSGRVDDDLFEGKELKADALHIDKIDATFIFDENYVDRYGMIAGRDISDFIEVSGNVTNVSDDEFRIHTGSGDFTVEIDDLATNPIDDAGLIRIRTGDWVNVLGRIDSDWLEGREIVASSVDLVRLDVIID